MHGLNKIRGALVICDLAKESNACSFDANTPRLHKATVENITAPR